MEMNWKLVMILGATALIPGALGIFNLYPPPVEFAVWTVLAVVWVVAIQRTRAPNPFLAGLFTGVVAGVLTGLVQGGFIDAYLDNHAEARTQFADYSAAEAGFFVGVFALVAGTVQGAVVGLIAWLVRRYGAKRSAPTPTG